MNINFKVSVHQTCYDSMHMAKHSVRRGDRIYDIIPAVVQSVSLHTNPVLAYFRTGPFVSEENT